MNKDRYELLDGWLWTTAIQVAKIITGNTPSKSEKSNYGDFLPWVKPPQLDSESPITDTPEKLSKKGAKLARILSKDSVLVSCIGLLGKVGLAGCELATNQQINALTFYDIVLPKYGYFYCRSKYFKDWLQSEASATTLSIVNKGRFSEAPIPLPPLNEQKRIVQKIDNLLDRLNKTKQEIAKILPLLKKFRQSVLAKAFCGELTKEWRANQKDLEPASKLLERIREERKKILGKKYEEPKPIDTSNLSELPEGWEWIRLGTLIESMANGIYKPDKFYSNKDIVCLRMYNIENGQIVLKNLKRMILTKDEIRKYSLFPGDLLVNRVNSRELVGKAAVIKDYGYPLVFESKNIRVRFVGDKTVLPRYISYLFLTRIIRDRFELKAKQTVGMATVSQPQIAELIIPIPSLGEIRQIVKQIEVLWRYSQSIENTIGKAKEAVNNLPQSIFTKAFRGELVEQDPNDESTNMLPKRIKENRKVDF